MVMLLPEDQREVLLLVTVEGLAYRDVADILQIPIGTVTSRLARARDAIRTAFATAPSLPPSVESMP
jgi:RNA polymerase sigma-70 factor (ECF subfamily)